MYPVLLNMLVSCNLPSQVTIHSKIRAKESAYFTQFEEVIYSLELSTDASTSALYLIVPGSWLYRRNVLVSVFNGCSDVFLHL